MKIAILTIFPEMFESLLNTSILGRAQAEGLISVQPVDIRPFSAQKHRNTDDYPFGGGAGMVMTPQPIVDAVQTVRARGFSGPCLSMSPRGKPLTQAKVRELAARDGLILLCGHYEGVDQRALDLVVDEEISLGDFILTGGELAAMAVVDAVARLVPGVLGSSESAEEESFSEGLLEYPQYTRPREYRGLTVPEVLLNGDHAKIRAWRRKQSLRATLARRPDLFATAPMTDKERSETLAEGAEPPEERLKAQDRSAAEATPGDATGARVAVSAAPNPRPSELPDEAQPVPAPEHDARAGEGAPPNGEQREGRKREHDAGEGEGALLCVDPLAVTCAERDSQAGVGARESEPVCQTGTVPRAQPDTPPTDD
ncbi:MAG TPA: tRNA (guanosine(37)-N1)-methyltransferase TrmD [Candidatus Limiplasma sp.]|nr:tRNA (guanosine(37)-N1)-methyltransferase TrmD [Candidatus Limiplasma sp.]